MPKLPTLDIAKRVNHSPHVVILGAGATRAAAPAGDANGVVVPVMNDLVGVIGIDDLLEQAGLEWEGKNFEDIYDQMYTTNKTGPIISQLEERLTAFFSGLMLPQIANAYDYLILSLREKDLIATFNWDPLLVQAYRRHARVGRLPRMVFLHGNVAIATCVHCRVKGYTGATCVKCRQPLTPTGLLYPVRQKDYTADPFIRSEWEELRHFLRHAYFLTIFGYSAPRTDTDAVELMKKVWDQNDTRTLAQVEIIDIKNKNELHAMWDPFITRQHFGIKKRIRTSYLCWHPRRSCEALAFATLQNDPWEDNWMPDVSDLEVLQRWIRPLLDEEQALEQQGIPLTGQPCPAVSWGAAP